MADEFRNEDYDEEEEVLEGDEVEDIVEEELTEHQRAEAADLVKLYKQHPEIWIPYETSVREKLNTKAPGAEPGAEPKEPELQTSLRSLHSIDSNHRTYPFLTQYERTKCISFRASQISNGAKPYILVPEGVTDSYAIAKRELEAKRLPFILKRPLPDGSYEVWRLRDLVLL